MSSSKSKTVQQDVNKTNISTITDIRGGIGVTGQNAVDLVSVVSALGANLLATSADVAKDQLNTSSTALSSAGKNLNNAIAKLSGGGGDNKTLFITLGIAAAVGIGVIFLLKG